MVSTFSFVISMVFSVAMVGAGVFVVLTTPSSDTSIFGYLLIFLGILFVFLNAGIRSRMR